MKIIYGSSKEKLFICTTYIAAAFLTGVILLCYQMFRPPYLYIPAYLCLCSILLLFFPLEKLKESVVLKSLYRVLPAILFMMPIYWASSFPVNTQQSLTLFPDYFLHGGEFFALGLFTARMVAPKQSKRYFLPLLLITFILVIAFGYLDEVHQSFVPGRHPSFRDLVADAVGGLGGILSYSFILYRSENGSENPARF